MPTKSKTPPWIEYSPEVEQAKKEGKPLLALESTIVSHGMPYPQNLETAKRVEEIVREEGVVPATICLLEGKIKIGLNEKELEYLAQSDRHPIFKANQADIPYLLTKKFPAATTVSGTLFCAHLAGLEVFATGGIGGVHRFWQESLDISADLLEMAKTPMAVVCSGMKSILDIQATLEYLETHLIPVIGLKTEELPTFYSRTSGIKLTQNFPTPEEVADYLQCKWDLRPEGGVLVANPIPEAFALPQEEVESLIKEALQLAQQQKIQGKEVTPFLLSQLKNLSGGKTLKANCALIEHNARMGAQIARELYQLRKLIN